MFCAEMFHAVGPQGFSKPYRFSPGGRTGFGPAFTMRRPIDDPVEDRYETRPPWYARPMPDIAEGADQKA